MQFVLPQIQWEWMSFVEARAVVAINCDTIHKANKMLKNLFFISSPDNNLAIRKRWKSWQFLI